MKQSLHKRVFFLFFTVPLLLQSVIACEKNIDFNSEVKVYKTRICTINITQEGQNPVAVYRKHGKSGMLELEGNTSIKVIAQAEGGRSCRLGKIQLGITHTNTEVNGTPALHTENSDYYFPFDYALGDSQLISTQKGETVSGNKVYDKIHKASSGFELPVAFIQKFDRNKLFKDAPYHGHQGDVLWRSHEYVYTDTNAQPFWLTKRENIETRKITADGMDFDKAVFTILPFYSVQPYDKASGKVSKSGLNDGDMLTITSILTVTQI